MVGPRLPLILTSPLVSCIQCVFAMLVTLALSLFVLSSQEFSSHLFPSQDLPQMTPPHKHLPTPPEINALFDLLPSI